jgi:hypothetical protein
MSEVNRNVWHCDICGHEWIKSEGKMPLQCPKCRTRKWNGGPVAATTPPVVPAPLTSPKPNKRRDGKASLPEPQPATTTAAHSPGCSCGICQLRRQEKKAKEHRA